MKGMIVCALVLLGACLIAAQSGPITVSGVSSGGAMAVQFHVSYSSFVNGAGIIAGIPYWCAQDNIGIAETSCMKYPDLISVTELIAATKFAYTVESIDSPSLLANSKVYLYSGSLDSVVVPGVVQKLQTYYESFLPAGNIATEYTIPSDHAIVTNYFGNNCSYLGSPYINNCNYDTAGAIFAQLLGNLKPPVQPLNSNIIALGQAPFVPEVGLDFASLADNGYLYVPSGCQNNKSGCAVHVVFHGCRQTLQDINQTFVTSTGYNGWAEANNIVIVYPQAKETTLNPEGCWDWWGYTGSAYATKLGVQIATVKNMVDFVLNNY